MADPDDEIERGLERPIIDRGHESVANHEMVEPGGWRRGNSIVSRIKNRPTSFPLAYVQPFTKVQRSAAAQSRSRLGQKAFVDPRRADRPLRIVNRNGAIADVEDKLDWSRLLQRREACAPSDAKKTRGTGRLNLISTPNALATSQLLSCALYARLAFCRAKTSWPSRSRIRTPIV
jgi:hypothetical protein